MKIRTKLFINILVITLALVAIVSVSFLLSMEGFRAQSFAQLTAVRETKARQIEQYFQQISDQILFQAKNLTTVEAMKEFSETFQRSLLPTPALASLREYYEVLFKERFPQILQDEVNFSSLIPLESRAASFQNIYITQNPNPIGEKDNLRSAPLAGDYGRIHGKYHPIYRDYLKRFGYYDIFLVEPNQGNIVYSVYKETDYATSLLNGPYKDSGIADAFRGGLAIQEEGQFYLTDFAPYVPSYLSPASFISTPIWENGRKLGVLIFQMPIDGINNVMTGFQNWKEDGLGESGETYLVGEDRYMRSNSRFFVEAEEEFLQLLVDREIVDSAVTLRMGQNGGTIGLMPVNTIATEASFAGETGTQIITDYRGIDVLSSYKILDLPGLNWAILSEVDESEAFGAANSMTFWLVLIGGLSLLVLVVWGTAFGQWDFKAPPKYPDGHGRPGFR
jgi:methyl-accepting chemotaxis protein